MLHSLVDSAADEVYIRKWMQIYSIADAVYIQSRLQYIFIFQGYWLFAELILFLSVYHIQKLIFT